MKLLVQVKMESPCGLTGPDVVILLYDFARNGVEIVLSGDLSYGSSPSSLPR